MYSPRKYFVVTLVAWATALPRERHLDTRETLTPLTPHALSKQIEACSLLH